jgi:hypothetical protein
MPAAHACRPAKMPWLEPCFSLKYKNYQSTRCNAIQITDIVAEWVALQLYRGGPMNLRKTNETMSSVWGTEEFQSIPCSDRHSGPHSRCGAFPEQFQLLPTLSKEWNHGCRCNKAVQYKCIICIWSPFWLQTTLIWLLIWRENWGLDFTFYLEILHILFGYRNGSFHHACNVHVIQPPAGALWVWSAGFCGCVFWWWTTRNICSDFSQIAVEHE